MRVSLLCCALACATASWPGAGVATPTTARPGPRGFIKHVLLIVQENRTPDNLFHGLAGADIADAGLDSSGRTVPLKPIKLDSFYDMGHSHADFVAMYDGGRMDGADHEVVHCRVGSKHCPSSHAAFRYIDPAEVAPYFQLAQTYTFADRMFQSNQGPSFPAHQYLIAGTSVPSVGGQYGDYFVAENPQNPLRPTGCVDAPPKETVALIDPQGVESAQIRPCFEHPTMMDLLDQAGRSWTYYAPDDGDIWTAPNAIDHLRNGPDWVHVVVPQSRVLEDIANDRLADVTWIIPDAEQSDHARITDGSGPSWVASIVNAVGASRYWKDSAIFITWDDWGGWYDHVAPPIHSVYESGFRVPLIVVSPYAKKAYVSHTTHLFGSLLKFIEETYGLPSLGYEDARSDDLADCFDFMKVGTPFSPVAAPLDAEYFIRRGRTKTPEGPDDDD